MTAAAQQLVQLYEVQSLTPEQIAEIENLAPTAVKSVLYANSAKYRNDTDTKKELDFNESDAELALSVIRRVAAYSEDDGTALKAAMFMRNDKKGRLDAKVGMKRLNINVTVLNEHFAKAAAAMAARVLPAPAPVEQKAIEV